MRCVHGANGPTTTSAAAEVVAASTSFLSFNFVFICICMCGWERRLVNSLVSSHSLFYSQVNFCFAVCPYICCAVSEGVFLSFEYIESSIFFLLFRLSLFICELHDYYVTLNIRVLSLFRKNFISTLNASIFTNIYFYITWKRRRNITSNGRKCTLKYSMQQQTASITYILNVTWF